MRWFGGVKGYQILSLIAIEKVESIERDSITIVMTVTIHLAADPLRALDLTVRPGRPHGFEALFFRTDAAV